MRSTFVLMAAFLSVVACKPPTPSYTVTDPKTGEKSQISVETKAGKESVTIESQSGDGTVTVNASGEPPKNLPSYVPPYPGAKYEGSMVSNMAAKAEDDPVAGGMVSFTSTDNAEKILAFYKAAFVKAGLKEKASGDFGGMHMTSFIKGEDENQGAQVVAASEVAGETTVQIIYSVAQ